jgi:hypothetical protein
MSEIFGTDTPDDASSLPPGPVGPFAPSEPPVPSATPWTGPPRSPAAELDRDAPTRGPIAPGTPPTSEHLPPLKDSDLSAIAAALQKHGYTVAPLPPGPQPPAPPKPTFKPKVGALVTHTYEGPRGEVVQTGVVLKVHDDEGNVQVGWFSGVSGFIGAGVLEQL